MSQIKSISQTLAGTEAENQGQELKKIKKEKSWRQTKEGSGF